MDDRMPGALNGTGPPQSMTADSSLLAPFKCNICQRSYSRVDHLTRHIRSHTAEKSYCCHVCSKAFTRVDLLKRHVAGHTDGRRPRKNPQARSSRVSQACKACVQAKLKCREEKPCERCENKGIRCVYETMRQKPSNLGDDDGSTNEKSSGDNSTGLDENTRPKGDFDMMRSDAAEDWMLEDQSVENIYARAPDDLPENASTMMPPSAYGTLESNDNLFADFLRDIMMQPQPATFEGQMQLDPTDTPTAAFRDLLSFGLDSNLELDHQDYTLMDFYQGKIMAAPVDSTLLSRASGAFEPPTPQSDVTNLPSTESVALGTEAFRRSLWCWTPVRQDSGQVEQINFTLPREDMSNSGAQFVHSELVASKVFGPESRDKLIAMILNTCQRNTFAKVMSSFPSAELLNSLMQCFLATHGAQTYSWIHLPTLRVNKCRPELLGAFLAAGATFSSSLTIRKLGFAIQEAVRLSLPRVCDENNSITRELDLLQAFLLTLDVGLWSGNKRKIELAESQALIVVTMCRRASRMLRSAYQTIHPLETDSGKVLEQKWRAWVEQESLKRLIFHLFVRDAQTSICLAVPMLVSYAELTLPLPYPSALFHAPTALAWKALYTSQTISERPPSLPQCLYDISPLNNFDAPQRIDVPFCFSLVAYGMWSLILEYRTLNSIVRPHPAPDQSFGSNALILGHRHQELTQLLNHFTVSLPSVNTLPASQQLFSNVSTSALESHILVSLLSCHLHVSFNDIQLFAGREGEEEARRVYPGLQTWVESREARTALWHAGQVIRYGKMIGGLREFFAVAVYHAGLVFWTYGVLSLREDRCRMRNGVLRHTIMDPEIFVWLDGTRTEEVQRYVALGKGVPCFSAGKDVTRIYEPENVMIAILRVLEGLRDDENGGSKETNTVVTPLVANLGQLIKELGSAARAVMN